MCTNNYKGDSMTDNKYTIINPESGEELTVDFSKDELDNVNSEEKEAEALVYRRKVKPYLNDIINWRQNGKGVKEICKLLDIHPDTFYRYKKKYPDFYNAYEIGNELLADSLETSLYKEAKGYEYTEQSVSKDGKAIDVKKYARPQGSLLKFALTNTRPKKWKNKVETSGTETVSGINIEALKQLSANDLKKLIQKTNEEDDE